MGHNIRIILEDLGYKLNELSNEFRARPLYRHSDNETSLRIYKNTGNWTDFSAGLSGNLADLVQLTLNLADKNDAIKLLKTRYHYSSAIQRPKIHQIKIYEPDILNNLLPDHSYWIKRNISEATLRLFSGGVCVAGKLKDRYVFPIFDTKKQIIGFAARSLKNSKIKWKIIGSKQYFTYPLFLNMDEINNQKQVILVESIGDCLSLWDSGFKFVLVLFGVELSNAVLNMLIRFRPQKIIIALNNDHENNEVGNKAAEKILSRLKRYFNSYQLKIALPSKKDFNDMNSQEILQWYQQAT